MTSTTLRYILLILFIAFGNILLAQDNGASIRGVILTPENEPSQFSTAVLMNTDSVFMGGTMSEADGSFVLDKLKPGNYLVMIRNVEFQTYVTDVIEVEDNNKVSLGEIVLQTRLAEIDEVVVKGERSILEVHPDKMVFNVANSISSSGNNVIELLSKSPGVLVDMDKNITLQGKAGVKIYINGRPARLSGSDLTSMLENMQSDNIQSIEIIANPSAKYEAEGAGGIINIILKKNVASGFNGTVTGSYIRGTLPRQNGGLSLNNSGEKVNLFSTFNYTDNYWFDNFEETKQQGNYLLEMESNNINNYKGFNFTGGMDFMINSESNLGIDGRFLQNKRVGETNSETFISNEIDLLPAQLLASGVDMENSSENYNVNAHYSFVPNRSSSFTADVSYALYNFESSTVQPNTYYRAGKTEVLDNKENQFDTGTGIDLFSAKIDYEKKFTKLSFSTGAKYSYVGTSNELMYYDIVDGNRVVNDNRSNTFSYLEKITAGYAIFNYKPNEKFGLEAGLRVENTSSLGELVSAVPTNDDVVARNYTSYFPNIGISYNDQKNHSIGVSYGRRIGRPNYQDLNPFESIRSEISSWKGNPFLRPNYISNYQVNYSFKNKVFISNTYSVTRDFFATIFIVTGDKSTVLTPRNMNKVTNNGLSINYPQRVTDWWQLSSFLIYNHEKYDGDIEGTVIDLTADIYSFNLQNNLKLPFDIDMEISYYFRSPWIWRGTIYVKEFHVLNMGLKKQFFNDRLQVQITANDILHTSSDYYYNSDYGGMIINGVRKFDNRRFGINATYTFGNQKAKAARKKQSAIDDELNRIGN